MGLIEPSTHWLIDGGGDELTKGGYRLTYLHVCFFFVLFFNMLAYMKTYITLSKNKTCPFVASCVNKWVGFIFAEAIECQLNLSHCPDYFECLIFKHLILTLSHSTLNTQPACS